MNEHIIDDDDGFVLTYLLKIKFFYSEHDCQLTPLEPSSLNIVIIAMT